MWCDVRLNNQELVVGSIYCRCLNFPPMMQVMTDARDGSPPFKRSMSTVCRRSVRVAAGVSSRVLEDVKSCRFLKKKIVSTLRWEPIARSVRRTAISRIFSIDEVKPWVKPYSEGKSLRKPCCRTLLVRAMHIWTAGDQYWVTYKEQVQETGRNERRCRRIISTALLGVKQRPDT